jgi:threonine dehydrogenase-like Zn-dependent dehydrogenase
MKANCWYGKNDVRVEQVPEPKILNPRDAIVRITSTAICGSDLHLYNGYIPALKEMTGGRGPDACIDAVGMEAHTRGVVGAYDRVKQAVMLETERPHVLREAIMACRNGGTVSVPGVYGGFLDKIPFGSVMSRALTIKTGQTHVQRYMRPLLERIQNGEIDPSFVITHRMRLEDAPKGYEIFKNKRDNCIKVVLKP